LKEKPPALSDCDEVVRNGQQAPLGTTHHTVQNAVLGSAEILLKNPENGKTGIAAHSVEKDTRT